jgi:hypothetical protein
MTFASSIVAQFEKWSGGIGSGQPQRLCQEHAFSIFTGSGVLSAEGKTLLC